MPSISYAITACNEHDELERLLDQLDEFIKKEDEILVQLDTIATKQVKKVAEKYNIGTDYGYHRIICNLNNNFDSFKNNLKAHCSKDYIFFIDADEYLSKNLITALSGLLNINSEIEMYIVPRVVEINKVNWPDYQTRIIKNLQSIEWENGRLVGAKTISYLPHDNEDWALYHSKIIKH